MTTQDLVKYAERKYIYFFILAGLCFLAYANSLNNAFVCDDIPAILENPNIRYPLSSWLNPQELLNASIYKFWRFNVLPYHLASIILHFINTILVFYFLRLFFRIESSFLSAALFAVHPIHTEAVTWISGRPYLFLAFSTLIAYLIYYKAATTENTKNKSSLYILSLIIFSYFIFGNYFYLLFPFFVMLSDIIFNREKNNWRLWIPFFLIIALRLIFQAGTLNERIAFTLAYKAGETQALRNPFFPFVHSIFTHLWLLFWPVKLTFFHEPVVFYPSMMWSGLIAFVALACFLPYLFKKAKSILLGIVIFILFLAPTYSPLPVAFVVAERYAYLPSVSFSMLAAFCYERYSKKINSKLIMAIFIFIIAAYGIRTFIRNMDYSNVKRFWNATLKVSPNSPLAHNEMGRVYLEESNTDKALTEFNAALKLNPNLSEAYNNRGHLYQQNGNTSQAVSDYTRAIQINPDFAQAYNNRGIAYKSKGEIDKAVSDYDKALRINPNYAEVYYNRGNAYNTKGERDKAISDYDKAIRINPYIPQFYANRAVTYFLRHEYDKGRQDLRKARSLGYKINPQSLK